MVAKGSGKILPRPFREYKATEAQVPAPEPGSGLGLGDLEFHLRRVGGESASPALHHCGLWSSEPTLMHHFAGRGVGGEAAAVDPVNPADRCGEEPKMHRAKTSTPGPSTLRPPPAPPSEGPEIDPLRGEKEADPPHAKRTIVFPSPGEGRRRRRSRQDCLGAWKYLAESGAQAVSSARTVDRIWLPGRWTVSQ
ncbi:hypothetical protein CB1_002529010 [Camelus ferus]|nr:hypothetical protein CB1_002529010 [Camelus ferus]